MHKLLKTISNKVEPAEKPLYEGFKKIEDKSYEGPTSLKYWM